MTSLVGSNECDCLVSDFKTDPKTLAHRHNKFDPWLFFKFIQEELQKRQGVYVANCRAKMTNVPEFECHARQVRHGECSCEKAADIFEAEVN